jgi:hypothetical protein
MDQSLEKLIFDYLVKKLLALYGIRLFITIVRSTLSWDRSVRSKSTCLVSLSSIIILFSHLGVLNGLFVSENSLKSCVLFTTFSVRLFQIWKECSVVTTYQAPRCVQVHTSVYKPIFPSA